MITYMIDAIQAVIGQVPKIGGCPDFGSLWGLKHVLTAGLKKLKNVGHSNDGYTCYLMPVEEYALVSTQ